MKMCVLFALAAGAAAAQVPIHDIDDLYENAGTAGATLLLDPVTFTLDSRGPVTLGPGTALVGQAGSVIDGTQITPFGSGLLRIGRDNTVSGLAIRGPTIVQLGTAQPIADIDASLVDAANPTGVSVDIHDCHLVGGNLGIALRHAGRLGLASQAILDDNVIEKVTGYPGSAAVLVQNSTGADGSSWTVILRNNTLAASMRGLLVVSLSVAGAVNDVLSQGNTYRGNTIGFHGIGGRDNNANFNTGAALDSAAYFVSNGDVFDANTNSVTLYGGLHTVNGDDESTGNLIRAQFLHTTFAGGRFQALGALGNAGISPGGGNAVELLLRHTSAAGGATFVVANSLPAGGDDSVTLLGSDVAFERTNDGFVAPDDSFFSGG